MDDFTCAVDRMVAVTRQDPLQRNWDPTSNSIIQLLINFNSSYLDYQKYKKKNSLAANLFFPKIFIQFIQTLLQTIFPPSLYEIYKNSFFISNMQFLHDLINFPSSLREIFNENMFCVQNIRQKCELMKLIFHFHEKA